MTSPERSSRDEVFAVGIEDVLIDAGRSGIEAGAEFVGENPVAQLLRAENFAEMASPTLSVCRAVRGGRVRY